MEAQLIDPSFEQSVIATERCPTGRNSDSLREVALAARLDTYLRAAGAKDAALRRHLVSATCDVLATRGFADTARRGAASWADIIAAADTCLAAQICSDTSGAEAQSTRGRVALQLGPAVAAQTADPWGTPPRRRRRMRAQSLSPWRPHLQEDAARLFHYQIRRSTQGLAACICWLFVLLIP